MENKHELQKFMAVARDLKGGGILAKRWQRLG
jgi:hypothetical protein